MTDTLESMFGELVEEAIPEAPPRPAGKGREPVKWEEHLAPLEEKLLEKPHRLWSYEVKTGAVSRRAAVAGRLATAAPEKNWELKVRPIPNSNPELFGVYAVYHGPYTPEEQLANAKSRADAKAKREASKEAKAAEGTPDAESESAPVEAPPAQTAKEKLAAKAAK